ncbi:MAG: hypothetical protein IJS20_08925 [Bacteroidales bacterium]|nr:hypothetical protein [Bacteroidales bacterium]
MLLQYSKPIFSRFFPNTDSIIGIDFDVFGIFYKMSNGHNEVKGNMSEEEKREFIRREAEVVKNRVIKSLMQELNISDYNGSFFEVPYNRDLHLKMLGLYYYKGTNPNEESSKNYLRLNFLRRRYLDNIRPLCAPKFADVTNKAINLPIYWCFGVECFHNNIKAQTLDECHSWRDYSLFHLIEIIGFPKLKKTDNGLSIDDSIAEFISCANRAMKIFKRLKCRNCGHLLYPIRNSGFNRYNYFSCINPTCQEYNKTIYLSYCFNCKKGLIDSRDSAKCPNGWYICPKCLHCCTDEQYDRQVQRFIIQKLPIPQRIKQMVGKGHNDKGVYYCPFCGHLTETIEEHGVKYNSCLICKKRWTI